jgi:hypothetical protein
MTVQIVHKNAPAARSPHFAQDLDTLRIGQVVKRQRTDHRIEGCVTEREAIPVSDNGCGSLRPPQTRGINIERHDTAASRLHERIANVAPACGNVEYRETPARREKTLDRSNASEFSVNDSQFTVGLIELRGRS